MLCNNGASGHTSAVSGVLNDSTPIGVNSGYTGLVDEVVVLGKQGFYAMDDFTYNTGRGVVPEPTSLALVLLAGAVGVSVTRRRAAPQRHRCTGTARKTPRLADNPA